MSSKKYQEIAKMKKEERDKKLEELKVEYVKNQAVVSKSGNSKNKEIRKMIARILTANTKDKGGINK